MAAGHSYLDPVYDTIEAALEKKHGLPKGLMSSIRTKGERSNADQVSPVGARTVYQIMPHTRGLFFKKYKIDAYTSKEAAAEVAALHLKESFSRGGDWNLAVREYHGGPDRSKWGPENAKYVARAGTGSLAAKSQAIVNAKPMDALPEAIDLSKMNVQDLMNLNPADLGNTRKSVGPVRRDPGSRPQAKKDAALASAVGPGGLPAAAPVDLTGDWSTEVADQKADEAEALAATQTTKRTLDGGTVTTTIDKSDRWNAAVQENWILAQLTESFDRDNVEVDREWIASYTSNWDEREKDATSEKERDQLRAAVSQEDYDLVLQEQAASRENQRLIEGSGHGTLLSIGAALTDPAGFAIGAGVSKVAQLGKVGSGALWAAGRPAAAAGSIAAEGAVGNVLATELLDPQATSTEITMSALTGAAMGLAMTPLLAVGGKHDPASAETIALMRREHRMAQEDLNTVARTNLGPDATPDAVKAEVAKLDAAKQTDIMRAALASVPDDMRFLSEDTLLTADKQVLAGVEQRANLEAVADTTERGMIAEQFARAEAFEKAYPMGDVNNTVLEKAGMESTGLRLLKSESPIFRMVGRTLLESASGAGGRRRTAAIAQAQRERIYNGAFREFDSLATQFRKSEGVGLMEDFTHGTARRRFNERVFYEVEARGQDGYMPDQHPAVVRAADRWEAGMDMMRREQQMVGTVGSARLGENSVGYVQHQMDGAKVSMLTHKQQARVRAVYASQLVDPRNDFDQAFADKLAKKILGRAMARTTGSHDIPMNLHSPEAADIVRDSLEAMGVDGADLEKMMGKFSRGGASHTKRRLRLDMTADIGDGMRMGDLFKKDMSALYRSYSRRVSGEVALAQYGVMGKKGLDVLRTAAMQTGGNAKDGEAFDQIAAEFLNTPYGEHNHNAMDNVRIATSASRLGAMAFTQLGESGNAFAALGIHRTFASIAALPRLLKSISSKKAGTAEMDPILGSLDLLGGDASMDGYTLTRMFDVPDNDVQIYGTEQIGLGTRVLRAAGHLQATLSGHRMLVASQTRSMSEQIVRKALDFVRTGSDDMALEDMGIDAAMRAALKKDLPNIAEFDASGKLVKLDLMRTQHVTPHQRSSMVSAIERGASQIIQRTYTGETGKWAHDGFLKILTQFRTFSITSVEKQWGRNAANYGALKSSMYLMGAMSFAVPIHMARVQSKMVGMSDKDRKEYAEKNLSVAALSRATIGYVSASGLLGDVLDVGGGFASSLGGDTGEGMAQTMGARGQGQTQLIGGVIAPGVGLLQDVWQGAHGDGKKLAKALPGGNLPYVVPLINGLETEN
jgi:hypothetical protein